jgi:hypothetical protein
MDQLSQVSRRPVPPVVLYRDACDAPVDVSKLWIPDSKTFKMSSSTEVTWHFESIEDYTAEPYVTEVPNVDFLGHADRKSMSLLFDAFYLYGLQLIAADLEFMAREEWSLVKLVDFLIQLETGGAENIYTRIFDRKKRFTDAGLMWLPFLHGSGLTAKLGYTPGTPLFEPLPLYWPKTKPPPYVLLGAEDTDSDSDSDSDPEPMLDEPPSYECAVRATVASIKKPEVSAVEVQVDDIENETDITDVNVNIEDETETETLSEPDTCSADVAPAQPESTTPPPPQPTKPRSGSGRWLHRVRDFIRRRQITAFRKRSFRC